MALCIGSSQRANSGNQTKVVDSKNEEERSTKEPEGAFDEVLAENITEKVIESLNEPLGQILNTTWNKRHFLRSHTTEHDE